MVICFEFQKTVDLSHISNSACSYLNMMLACGGPITARVLDDKTNAKVPITQDICLNGYSHPAIRTGTFLKKASVLFFRALVCSYTFFSIISAAQDCYQLACSQHDGRMLLVAPSLVGLVPNLVYFINRRPVDLSLG